MKFNYSNINNNPSFQYFSELRKRLKHSLRPKHKNPNFESKIELKNYVQI